MRGATRSCARKRPSAPPGFIEVAIVARCELVQIVVASARTAARLDDMSDAQILGGYAFGVPPIGEFMCCAPADTEGPA